MTDTSLTEYIDSLEPLDSPASPGSGSVGAGTQTRSASAPAAHRHVAKVLDIDPERMAERIARAGGRHLADRHLRRHVYSVSENPYRWALLRDTGRRVTVCANELPAGGGRSRRSAELAVADFDQAHALLEQLGFTPRAYHENHRSSWLLEDVRLEIDSWPLIPPFLGLEGRNAAHVHSAADRLELPRTALTGDNTAAVHARYGITLSALTNLRF
ncbi:adenylate cyclase [Streptomyces sp. HNM0574]|uniref:adenylate cyclase n=1 Tax=Streptomyces sp. HNM0574 TaxID=2714954 RepID=UPI00146BD325|nr:adenylate cyclase [Streptomyces sp. HNM0574]NLU68389.1 adenylate cyclase [Streptomyces sp. HNM0574]